MGGFPDSSVGKESTCNAGDPSSIPGSGECWRRDRLPTPVFLGFACGSDGKESVCNVEDLGSNPGLGRSPGEGKDYPTPVFWPGKSHGLTESDTTEQLSLFSFLLPPNLHKFSVSSLCCSVNFWYNIVNQLYFNERKNIIIYPFTSM